VAALAAAIAVSACGGRDGAGGAAVAPRNLGAPLPDVLQGTWTRCEDHWDGTSTQRILVTTATTFSASQLNFPSSGSSPCTGYADDVFENSGRLGVGDPVAVPFGGGTVEALELNESSPTTGDYQDLVYVDEAPEPDVLYLGDASGARRPTQLLLTMPFTREP
jgi:hypothetical protein